MSDYGGIVDTLPHVMDGFENGKDSGLSLDAAVEYINSMDFSEIQEKLLSEDPLLCRRWSRLEVEVGIQYYRNFLFLNKKYLSVYPVLPPLLEVDEIWHHHILDTRRYTKDSVAIFGRYFHHYPYFGTRSTDDLQNLNVAFEKVQMLHEFEFGAPMVSVWGIAP